MLLNHFHIFPPGVIDKQDPTVGTADEIVRILDGYDRDTEAVVFAPHSEGANARETYIAERMEPNQWLSDVLRRYPRLHGFVTVNPGDRHAIDILRTYIGQGFKGVKMHNGMFRISYDDPRIDAFYAEVAKLAVPIYFHTGPFPNATARSSMPLTLDRLAYTFPRLQVIIGHLGGYAFFNQTWAMLQTHPNCYADLTTAFRPEHPYYVATNDVLNMIRRFGSHRIMYGTDYPFTEGSVEADIRADIETIQSWPLPDGDKASILGGTLRHLLNGGIGGVGTWS